MISVDRIEERGYMICPGCGRNNIDAKFCPECGRDLRTVTNEKNAPRASGQVYCPSCFSTSVSIYNNGHIANEHLMYRSAWAKIISIIIQEKLRRRMKRYGYECVCLKCNCRWYPKMVELNKRNLKHLEELMEHLPTGRLCGIGDSHIKLNQDHLMIYSAKKKWTKIFYHEILAVSFRKNLGSLHGWLSVRGRDNKYRPLPNDASMAEVDNLTVFYDTNCEQAFYLAYLSLKAIAKENKKAGVL